MLSPVSDRARCAPRASVPIVHGAQGELRHVGRDKQARIRRMPAPRSKRLPGPSPPSGRHARVMRRKSLAVVLSKSTARSNGFKSPCRFRLFAYCNRRPA